MKKGEIDRYTVDQIEIIGNKVISNRAIKKAMLTRCSGIFSRPIFHNSLFRDDLRTIRQLYHNNGFLDVDINSQIIAVDSLNNRLLLKILITEGQPTVIDSITFSGNYFFSTKGLLDLIVLKPGRPFNESQLEKDNFKLLTSYARSGYIDTIIKPELKYQQNPYLISINFRISEGIQSVVKGIALKGLEKTKPHVVTRELLIKPGQVFNYQKMLKSRQRLLAIGLFDNVNMTPVLYDSLKPEFRNLSISVVEKQGGEFNFGFGFGSYEKLRGSTEFFHNNFRGLGYQIGTRFQVSYRLQRFEFSFTNPWLFNLPIKLDVNTFGEHKDEPNYQFQAYGVTSTTGTNITEHSKISLTFKSEKADYFNIKDITEIRKKNRGNIRSLRLNYVRDNRDSQINTTKGSYLDLKLETAGGFLKGTHTFLKLMADNRFFMRVNRNPRFILGVHFFYGWMRNLGESSIIPLNERFYAGGDGSIRGYSRRSVGPKTTTGLPTGGKITFITNFELRFPLYKRFGGTIFWDAGDVWQNDNEIQWNQFRHGAGIGLRFGSKLGIVRVDVGLKVDQRKDEKFGKFYLTLGHAF